MRFEDDPVYDPFEAWLTTSKWERMNRHLAKHHPTAGGGSVHGWLAAAEYWKLAADRHFQRYEETLTTNRKEGDHR